MEVSIRAFTSRRGEGGGGFQVCMARARESIGDLSLFISMHGGTTLPHTRVEYTHTHTYILGNSTKTSPSLSLHIKRDLRESYKTIFILP